MFAFSRISAARKLERIFSLAGYKAPKEATSPVFPGLDLQKVVSTLIDEGVYQGLSLSDRIVQEINELAKVTPVFTKDKPT